MKRNTVFQVCFLKTLTSNVPVGNYSSQPGKHRKHYVHIHITHTPPPPHTIHTHTTNVPISPYTDPSDKHLLVIGASQDTL